MDYRRRALSHFTNAGNIQSVVALVLIQAMGKCLCKN